MELITLVQLSPLTLLHILGVALGLGIATGLDLVLASQIIRNRRIRAAHVETAHLLARVVSVAMVLLWLSGLGFLAWYAAFTPEKLDNPKIWSKLMIVTILTINGKLIHHLLLPGLQRSIGKRLLESLPACETRRFFILGAVSMVSWYFPFLYGTIPQLNFAFSFTEFSIGYLATLTAAILIALTLHAMLRKQLCPPEPQHAMRLRELPPLLPLD